MDSLTRSILVGAALLLAAGGAAAQYPERPSRLAVPQAAGSATDNVARTLELSKQLGQNMVVDNRPGGAPTIGNFAQLIRRDSAKWAEVVRRPGARID